jgi:hypothetical protein
MRRRQFEDGMVTWLDDESFPSRFVDPEELDNFLSRSSRALATDLAAIHRDIIVLGVGGKMGPTLARLARNAAPDKRVIGVSRFSGVGLRKTLEAWGVETIKMRSSGSCSGGSTASNPQVIFMADLIDGRDTLKRHLRQHGFSVQRSFLRMGLHCSVPLGDPTQLFVVAGPEFG